MKHDIKIENIILLSNCRIVAFFDNKETRLYDMKSYAKDHKGYERLLDDAFFKTGAIEVGGHAVVWSTEIDCSKWAIYDNGISIPLSVEDFIEFAANEIINTKEAMEVLKCTRQNISSLVKREKLQPLKAYPKGNMFLKSDVLKRKAALESITYAKQFESLED